MAYQRILTIQDISCVGQCSLTVALPILSACGHETAALPTAVLSTHTGRFQGYTFRDLTDDIPGICAHWEREGLDFSAVYTGYLASARQIALVRDVIRSRLRPGGVLIVDPAMADDGRLYSGFGTDVVDAMRTLCAEADFILPNVTEAALLAGLSFSSADETLLYAQQVKDAVITSVGSGNRIGYLARLDGRVTLVQKESVDMTVHGAGDVFTSALSGELLSGQAPQTALLRAADFCDSCIHETAKRQPGHWYGLAFEPVLKGTRV